MKRLHTLAPLGAVLLFVGAVFAETPAPQHHATVGPIYVPLDSWIYPALKRLASMGYAPDAESLALPWTRQQCALLVEEAADIASQHSPKVSAPATTKEALRLIAALQNEFTAANKRPSAGVESVYARYLQAAGTPLRDSYHFGQTFTNDFGRPYNAGGSTVDGLSAYGSLGRFSGYFRGEYQQANGSAPYGQNVETFLAAADGVPLQPSSAIKSTQTFQPLEAYVGAKLGIFDATLGKQSMWWGPGENSAFHFSNNAEPFFALRVAQSAPALLPGPLRFLGRIRTQFLIGELSGHRYPAHPLINAQKITLQLTPDFEIGFTRTALFGGNGHPLTVRSVFRSFFSTSSTGNTAYGAANDPGDRRSGFDFRWRVPLLRRYLTIYTDSLADDEPNPLDNPRRSAWGPGLYVTQFPRLRHLDLRLETYSTWLYAKDEGGQFIYWNNQYRDAYTNNGNLLGSWAGRDARAYTAQSTYWLSARDRVTASFRQTKTGSNFLPGGGTQTDISLTAYRLLRPDLQAMVFVQYERYFFPLLGSPRRDVAAELQLTFYPSKWSISR